MEEIFTGVVAKSDDSGDYDKLLKIITAQGVKTALVRGVKRPKAKLRAYSMPFAFCQYTAAKKGGLYVVTSASPLGDIYNILLDADKIIAGSVCLEAALNSFIDDDCAAMFIFMLKRLKDISGVGEPFAAAARFIQYIIHNSGFAYNYKKADIKPKTVMELLAVLYFLDPGEPAQDFDSDLVKLALKKLIDNFERKFECSLNTKKSLDIY